MRYYWSDEFVRRLDVGGSPMFAVDFDDDIALGEFGAALPVRLVLHSHGISAGTYHIPHAIERVSGSGQSVGIRTWASRFGTMTLTLAGVDIANLVARRIPLGLPCRFKVGFEGMSFEDWETVGIYRFDGLSGSRNRWLMKFGDLGKVLQSAVSRTSSDSTAIFEEFSTTGNYFGSVTTAADDAGLKKDGEAGARGALRLTATGGLDIGKSCFVKYSGITDVGGVPNITTIEVDALGTERIGASGSPVDIEHVNYIHDDLPRLVEKFIVDGSDAIGTMPDGLSMGYGYSGFFNVGDFGAWQTKWDRFTKFKADLFSTTIVQNPYRFLSKLMADCGAWLVMKEGRLSWRFAYDVTGVGSVSIPTDFEINDEDIISVDRYNVFNSDAREQVVNLRFLDGSSTTDVTTNPAVADLPNAKRADTVAYNDDLSTTNRANAQANLENRLSRWYQSIPDELTLNLRGWRWMHMVPGDVASITSKHIPDFFSREIGETLDATPYMVTSINTNWTDFSCTVELSRPRYLSAFTLDL